MKRDYNPEKGTSGTYRRLHTCVPCISGFHLSCKENGCICRDLNHSSQQSIAMAHAASEVQLRPRLAGTAIAS